MTDTSVIDQLSPEDKAALAADILREQAEKDRIAAQEAARVKERIFKSRLGSMQMATFTGTRILFVNHMHITNIQEVIDYLEGEIKRGCKDIYIDQNEVYFEPDNYDPEKRAYKRARAEIEAEYAARLAVVTNPGRDMGTYTQQKLTPASTATIEAVAAGGSGASLAQRVAMMNVKK
jgi:hypothetical protein